MNNDILKHIEKLCLNFALESIDKASNDKKILNEYEKLSKRNSFIPVVHSMFSNLIQSMAIQQGNLLEEIVRYCIENEPTCTLSTLSGTKSLKISYTANSHILITNYIQQCKLNSKSKSKIDKEPIGFDILLKQILINETSDLPKTVHMEHDIDMLFIKDGHFYYYELKTNDNHDSDKKPNIYRKILETYAGLINILDIKKVEDLKIASYYFNSKAKLNHYFPTSNIDYLHTFFDKHITVVSYNQIQNTFNVIGKNKEVIKKIDELYLKIMSEYKNGYN